ncbi:MAG TPA: hypothetical protein VKY74_04450 [Chloroflexia bacterium]|nr:hypothetical protein [Chloroflexia bacterium]
MVAQKRHWLAALAALLALTPTLVSASGSSYIGPFNTINVISSTVPANGDINPYGTVVVPTTVGALVAGNVLVSNFNNSANLQGTGTTIVQVAPNGAHSLFARINAHGLPGPCPGGIGLTTALAVLSRGWVIVGSLPTADGTAATAQADCLIVLNSRGQVVETIAGGPINGPWDMTALDGGSTATLFVTNVLNDTVARSPHVVRAGTVVRLQLSLPADGVPTVVAETIVGSGFAQRTDPGALVIGPTGVGLSSSGTLYVADSLANRIAAIPDALTRTDSAGTGTTVTRNGALNDPLGLTVAPNGDILTVNGNDGFLVETTPGGVQIASKLIDATGNPPGAGALFGLAIVPGGQGVYFVDDASNTLNILH